MRSWVCCCCCCCLLLLHPLLLHPPFLAARHAFPACERAASARCGGKAPPRNDPCRSSPRPPHPLLLFSLLPLLLLLSHQPRHQRNVERRGKRQRERRR